MATPLPAKSRWLAPGPRRDWLAFTLLWAVLIPVMFRGIAGSDQFVFSEQQAFDRGGAATEWRLFREAWNPQGLGAGIPPALDTFYGDPTYPHATGLGSSWAAEPGRLARAAALVLAGDPSVAQHLLYWSVVPGAAAAMFLLLRRWPLPLPAQLLGSFAYAANPATFLMVLGGGSHKVALFVAAPLILHFVLQIARGEGSRLRPVLGLALACGAASAFARPVYAFSLAVLLGLLAVALAPQARDAARRALPALAASQGLHVLLALPPWLYLGGFLGATGGEGLASVSGKYAPAVVLDGLRHVFASSTPLAVLSGSAGVGAPSFWYGASPFLGALGLGAVVLACAALAAAHRKPAALRDILLLTSLVALGVGWSWLTQMGATLPLYEAMPALLLYNAPDYFVWLTLLGLAPLVAFGSEEAATRVRSWLLQPRDRAPWHPTPAAAGALALVLVASPLAAFAAPGFSGDLMAQDLARAGYQIPWEPYTLPPVYEAMGSWVAARGGDDGTFRVLVLPFTAQVNYALPAVGSRAVPAPPALVDLLVRGATTEFGRLAGLLHVRYILLNLDTPPVGTDPTMLAQVLDRQHDLQRLPDGPGFRTYENLGWVPLVHRFERLVSVYPEGHTPFEAAAAVVALPGYAPGRVLVGLPPGGPPLAREGEVRPDEGVRVGPGGRPVEADHVPWAHVVKPPGRTEAPDDVRSLLRLGPSGRLTAPEGSLAGAEELTVSLWLRPQAQTDGAMLLTTSPEGGNVLRWILGRSVVLGPLGSPPDPVGTSGSVVLPAPAAPPHAWSHFVLTLGPAGLRLFRDGELAASTSLAPEALRSLGRLHFGAAPEGTPAFQGYLAGVQVYAQQLEPHEVAGLHQAGLEAAHLVYRITLGAWPLRDGEGPAATQAAGPGPLALQGEAAWVVLTEPRRMLDGQAILGYGVEAPPGVPTGATVFAAEAGIHTLLVRARALGPLRIAVDDQPEVLPAPDPGRVAWYWLATHLEPGTHQVSVASLDGNVLFVDTVVLCGPGSALCGPAEPTGAGSLRVGIQGLAGPAGSVERSWTERTVLPGSGRYVVLGERFDPAWEAEGGSQHFRAGGWANGWVAEGPGEVGLRFDGQGGRDLLVAVVLGAWIGTAVAFVARPRWQANAALARSSAGDQEARP